MNIRFLDTQDFWREVRLLAKNNYGNWKDKDEAREKVETAVDEVLDTIHVEIKERLANQPGRINELVDEMMDR